ncbi:PepSY domain-containing protein [Candidatus Accumulibacter sp. ACC007]|uniref:PepSY domain-containing protein n=1 Tax=Candidatus Accumulibacter sp. ACC007 TaxID=2823333 RepID=UPI0025C6AEE4|nr:PepSY domain-containing protein [Candidatus Accumulibacter sp. ACC007]
MTLKGILPALAIGIVLGAASTFITPAFSDDKRPPAAAAAADRQWLSIPQIVEKLEAAGYRNIEEIEREHGKYEVRATHRDGKRSKLYVHPQTGEVMDYRQGERQRASDERGERRSGSADCNERRCRDDLPQAAVGALPPAGK